MTAASAPLFERVGERPEMAFGQIAAASSLNAAATRS
jgi:hypothetical protein